MKRNKPTFLRMALLAVFAIFLGCTVNAATGEVTRSGSTWTAKVNGSTVYTGSRMFDAVTAACNSAGSNSTINIRNSGDSGNDGGNVYAIRPLAGQVLDFHGVTVNCNSSGDLIVVVHADRRSNITVQNLHVTGNPRYALWFRGCSNITLTNITMDLSNDSPVGLGIRVDASTGSANNLTINGNININGSAGHAIETYTVGGVNIGNVSASNTGGCGVLLNDSWDCNVGVVTGNYNCPNAGYATFRVANANENTYCAGVYSRHSGRGFFSVTESRDCTVEWVDIAYTYSQCIYIQDSYNTHVLHGTTSNCGSSNLIRGGSGNSINLDGSTGGSSGGSGGGSSSNGTVNGTYNIVASHSGKAFDVYAWGTSNGTNICQWDFWGGATQQFNIAPVDGEWHRITPVLATDKALDIDGVSTADGANCFIWSYWGGQGQQFRFQSAGSGVWRIIARHSEKCLDVEGVSTANGANIFQWSCVSGASNQMFSLNKVSSNNTESEVSEVQMMIYPNPAANFIKLSIKDMNGVQGVEIFNKLGQKVLEKELVYNGENIVDIGDLSAGVYIVKVLKGKNNITKPIVIK